jgi:hypothetical protein
LLYVYWHYEAYVATNNFLVYLGRKNKIRKFYFFSRLIKIPYQICLFWYGIFYQNKQEFFIFFSDIDKYFKSKYGLILLPVIYDFFFELNQFEKKIINFLDSDIVFLQNNFFVLICSAFENFSTFFFSEKKK